MVQQGARIEINGSIRTGSYENQGGQKVYTTDVEVERCGFGESKGGSQQTGREFPGNAAGNGFMDIPDGVDAELPFN